MNKVSLTLESEHLSADDLEDCLESLRPALAMMSNAVVHINIEEED